MWGSGRLSVDDPRFTAMELHIQELRAENKRLSRDLHTLVVLTAELKNSMASKASFQPTDLQDNLASLERRLRPGEVCATPGAIRESFSVEEIRMAHDLHLEQIDEDRERMRERIRELEDQVHSLQVDKEIRDAEAIALAEKKAREEEEAANKRRQEEEEKANVSEPVSVPVPDSWIDVEERMKSHVDTFNELVNKLITVQARSESIAASGAATGQRPAVAVPYEGSSTHRQGKGRAQFSYLSPKAEDGDRYQFISRGPSSPEGVEKPAGPDSSGRSAHLSGALKSFLDIVGQCHGVSSQVLHAKRLLFFCSSEYFFVIRLKIF